MVDGADRRASERMLIGSDTTCSFVAPVLADYGAVRLRDVSMEGIGLILTTKVEVGSLLAVVVENSVKSFKGTFLVKVAHVTPVQGGYLVGGTFMTPLSYKDLTTLVM